MSDGLSQLEAASPVRACFLMRVRLDRLAAYLEAHQTVWAEMKQALAHAGWRDYSLFVDRETGLVVGYVVSDDFDRAQARMAEEEVNTRWQAAMSGYFEAVNDRVAPGEIVVLEEYFHLS